VLYLPRTVDWPVLGETPQKPFPSLGLPGHGRDKCSAKSFFYFISHHPQLSEDRSSLWHSPLPRAKPDQTHTFQSKTRIFQARLCKEK